jgi:hypothetical protein
MQSGLPAAATKASVPCDWARAFATAQGTLPHGMAAWAEMLLPLL